MPDATELVITESALSGICKPHVPVNVHCDWAGLTRNSQVFTILVRVVLKLYFYTFYSVLTAAVCGTVSSKTPLSSAPESTASYASQSFFLLFPQINRFPFRVQSVSPVITVTLCRSAEVKPAEQEDTWQLPSPWLSPISASVSQSVSVKLIVTRD